MADHAVLSLLKSERKTLSGPRSIPLRTGSRLQTI